MEFSQLGSFLQIYFGIVAFVLGTVFGSFLNCAAWRISHHMSFLKGRSICPNCRHELSAMDLIPIISFLLFRGRCRYCKEKISIRYPITELIFGILSLLTFISTGITPLFLRNFIFLCCLFCLSLVDLEIFEIPDGALVISVLAWVVFLPFTGWEIKEMLLHFLAGVVFLIVFLLLALTMDKLLKKESLGGGDIKLIAVIALYLGFVGTVFMAIFAAAVGLIVVSVINRGLCEAEPIPFGPFLSGACVGMMLFGQPLVTWYMDLLI